MAAPAACAGGLLHRANRSRLKPGAQDFLRLAAAFFEAGAALLVLAWVRAGAFLAGAGFFSVFAVVTAGAGFWAAFAADFFGALAAVAVSAAGVVAAAGAGAAPFLRPKRLPRGGAAASNSRQVSSVTALGSVSLGIRALRLPSVMYGP